MSTATQSGLSLQFQFGVTVVATASLVALSWRTRHWDGFLTRTMVLAMPTAAVAGLLLFGS